MVADKRADVVQKALDVLRRGEPISLDSAARRAGMTKPGLMHYFPSKEALMLGLLDHVAERWAAGLASFVPAEEVDSPSATARALAYIDFAFLGEFDQADTVVLSDPKLRERLVARWIELMSPWIELADEVPESERDQLTAARLMADGMWMESASNELAPGSDARERLHALARSLVLSST
ncbi:TetR family transcriptional regulator [Microbacterium sp. A8/3-1]|uniref:TetR family transcriptional regulator n=1 Tax=Microbacterium sp. A8/3-1 TaxID=3160749 RepID=A0AAU7VVJ1_9MICO